MKKLILFYCLLLIAAMVVNAQQNSKEINVQQEVELGGTKQWIMARGLDSSNPILLFLHGGPGFPEMPFAYIDSKELEKYFIVVNWDQRGCGKSFNKDILPETMTLEQFYSDTDELVQFLRKRFEKDKIYLLGHSWGSILGLHIVKEHPEYFHAYIGMGQVVDEKRAEKISYNYVLKKATDAKNGNDIDTLKNIGDPSHWDSHDLSTQRQLLAKYGGSFRHFTYVDLFKYWHSSPYYTQADKNNVLNGMSFSQSLMWDKFKNIDIAKEIKEISIPVYFFTGRHDYQTPFKLVEKYYKTLKAPYKEMVWFDDSGHFPNLDEPEKYQEILINKILPNSKSK